MSVQSDVTNKDPDPEVEVGRDEDQDVVAAPGEEAVSAQEQAHALAELEARAAENLDKYLRAAAELENVRKRASREVEKARKFALERFCGELLAVKDSLEMGLSVGVDADADALRQGSEATLKQLNRVFEQFGVSEVDPHGEPFDPELHEAMSMQPSDDLEPGSVLSVFQKGYTLNGRLLRPARVVVVTNPSAATE
jgi:molecular chaperone GrpE